MIKLRVYRIALVLSLAVNAILIGAITLYIHFAGLLDVVETAVGFIN